MTLPEQSSRRSLNRLIVSLAVLLVVATAIGLLWHTQQKTAALDSASGVVDGRPVAASIASD